MKKKILGIAVAITMLFAIVALAGCNGGREFRQVEFDGTIVTGHPEEPLLIRSREQLSAILDEYGIVWTSGLQRYDNHFFDENALILYFFGASGDRAPTFSVESIKTVGDDTVKLILNRNELTAGLAFFPINIVVEVERSIIGNATSIEVEVKIPS